MDKKTITLAAVSGKVVFAGGDGLRFAVSPEVADELARNLPRFACLARMILPDQDPENVEAMAAHLKALGFAWVPVGEEHGFWKTSQGKAYTPIGTKEKVTVALFGQFASLTKVPDQL